MSSFNTLRSIDSALVSLHYAYPIAIFGYFLFASCVAFCMLSEKKVHPRRQLLLILMLFTTLSYLTQIVAITIPSIYLKKWLGQQDIIIGHLSCILVFGLQFAMLSDETAVTWSPYIGSYGLSLCFELVLQIGSLSARTPGHLSGTEVTQLIIVAARYAAIVLVVTVYFLWRNAEDVPDPGTDAERQPLLSRNHDSTPIEVSEAALSSQASTAYGSAETTTESSTSSSTTDNSSSTSSSTTAKDDGDKSGDSDSSSNDESTSELPWETRQREMREEMEKRLKETGNWLGYAKRYLILLPYVLPIKNRSLQIRALLVGVCLLINNALNVFLPRQLGIIMDSLSHSNDKNPWVQVIIFALLKVISSQAGIPLLRQWLWLPVEYYSHGATSIAAYTHVLNLSSDFHDSKSSSDIMMAISSGQSIAELLESICFSAIPMLIDMVIAYVYLSATFGPYEGFITSATSIVFMYIAGRMIASLKAARRSEVHAWFEEHFVRQAGIQGWATVASFNQIAHEVARYTNAVKTHVKTSQNLCVGYMFAYAFQYLILLAGLLAGAFLAVYQVTTGKSTPGDFAMLLSYWTQLVAPLTYFASLGKSISGNLIHAEQLLEIMTTKATVVNKENAADLEFLGGTVEFKNVSFSYNDSKKDIVKNVSFHVSSGSTVAFVGATGAGKSTILKLLNRFYDVTSGSVLIDGQDIRDVDIHSLRSHIGIVPQSPVLFNDTVINNIRYARLDATDEEVHNACRAAAVHEQILGFSDGYDSRVGERGIKLSGGELQRVAIARAILKNPSIVLLDEATSSVDTETEHKIQKALQALCADRTTFVVAHRLSTVMNADTIIVIDGGEVVEHGSHDHLIQAGGKYANLWSKQFFIPKKDKAKMPKNGKVTDLVNDLPPEVTISEVTKASEAQTAENKGEMAADQSAMVHIAALGLDNSTSTVNTGDGHRTDNNPDPSNSGAEVAMEKRLKDGKKKEEPKLNPVAPSFTPRECPTTLLDISKINQIQPDYRLPTINTLLSEHADSTKPGLSQLADVSENPSECRTAAASGLILPSASDQAGTQCDKMATQQSEIDDSLNQDTAQGTEDAADQPTTGNTLRGSVRGRGRYNRVRWSRPRYSRRAQSKSEPSGVTDRAA